MKAGREVSYSFPFISTEWGDHVPIFPTKCVFLVKMKNAFVPVKRVFSVNTYL